MPIDRAMYWIKGDEGLPTGWAKDTRLTYTADVGGRARYVGVGAAVGPAAIRRRAAPVDGRKANRSRTFMVSQAYIEVVSNSALVWPASPGLGIRDGLRELALVVGSSVWLVNPSTGAVVATVRTGHTPSLRHHYRLEKAGSTSWNVYIDEVLVAQVPYTSAPMAASTATQDRARFSVGLMDTTTTAEALFDRVECALSLDVPLPREVEQMRRGLVRLVQEQASATVDAVVLATAGMVRDAMARMTDLWSDLTGGGVGLLSVDARHDIAPNAQADAWTMAGAGADSIQRDRWRLDATSGARSATYTFVSGERPDTCAARLRATWTLRSGSSGVSTELGAVQRVEDQGVLACARIFRSSTDGDFWTLMDGPLASDTPIGAAGLVNVAEPHEVEVALLPSECAILLVGGVVVSRVPWADLPASANAEVALEAEINLWDVEAVKVRLEAFDLGQRTAYRSRMAERLIPTTGCERNDEMDRWSRNRFALMEARGSSPTIVQEILRMTCGAGDYVSTVSTGRWELDVTYPDITPVVLDEASPARVVNAYVEWPAPVSGFSEAELARIVTKYILPISVYEMRYWFTVRYTVNATSSTPSTGTTRITLLTTAGLAVGDLVQVRDAANTIVEQTRVRAVVSTTVVDLFRTGNTWISGDFVRRLVRSS